MGKEQGQIVSKIVYKTGALEFQWRYSKDEREALDLRRRLAATVLADCLDKKAIVTVTLVRAVDRGYSKKPKQEEGRVTGLVKGFNGKYGNKCEVYIGEKDVTFSEEPFFFDIEAVWIKGASDRIGGSASLYFDHQFYGGHATTEGRGGIPLYSITCIEILGDE